MIQDFEIVFDDTESGVPFVKLRGELDYLNSGHVSQTLKRAATYDAGFVIVSVEHVTYLDSAALHLFMIFSTSLLNNRQQLLLIRPESAALARLFVISGFDQRVKLFDSFEEASAAC